jgi:16S rRNA (uracil1498-N3)-methyltransferase
MNIFYIPDIAGNAYTLDETESKHCVKVLRKAKGDEIVVVDGVGGYYTAKINDPNPRKCEIEFVSKVEGFGKRDYHLHLAVAPTKNADRFEWMVEKATEIGVDSITPILCHRSERKQINTGRLHKIALSAMKQSLKAYCPVVNNLINFDTFIKQVEIPNRFIAYCGEIPGKHLFTLVEPKQSVLVLIGPEGDFSDKEVERAFQLGYNGVSLGQSRLRTETAAMVACNIVNLINEVS